MMQGDPDVTQQGPEVTGAPAEVDVPGTQTDPEFSAVHEPSWDAAFACHVVLAHGGVFANEFLTGDWWGARSDELAMLKVSVQAEPGVATVVTTDPHSVTPGTMLVVLPSFGALLVRAWEESRSDASESAAGDESDFQGWVRVHVLDPAGQQQRTVSEQPPWRYDLTLERLAAEHSGERTLFVWPEPPDALSATELLGAPHFPDLPERPDLSGLPPAVAAVALDLWAQLEQADARYRLSLVHRGTDLVNILRRGTEPAYAARVDAQTGAELRALSKQLRSSAASAGWRLMGYADALLWPVAIPASGNLPSGFVAEAAIEVLRRATCVALPPAPNLARWERRLVELDHLRAQVER